MGVRDQQAELGLVEIELRLDLDPDDENITQMAKFTAKAKRCSRSSASVSLALYRGVLDPAAIASVAIDSPSSCHGAKVRLATGATYSSEGEAEVLGRAIGSLGGE